MLDALVLASGHPGVAVRYDNVRVFSLVDGIDADGDGWPDVCDNCPGTWNPQQLDQDRDGLGDLCDACPNDPENDVDMDGVCGAVDNCPTVPNSSQADSDLDGAGDPCDVCPYDPADDMDMDGVCGDIDNCPATPNADQANDDSDLLGNACDNCAAVSNPGQEDSDAWLQFYDYNYTLNPNGDLSSWPGAFNNDIWLAPDKNVHFERRGATLGAVTGNGFFRLSRNSWKPWDRAAMVREVPLRQTYTMSVDDLYRTTGSGYYVGLVVAYSDDDSLPLLDRDVFPQSDSVTPNIKIIVSSAAYWLPSLRMGIYYYDPLGKPWFWNGSGWQSSNFEVTVLADGFDARTELRHEIIKDENGYRARVTRLDAPGQPVILETTSVPPAAIAGEDREDFAALGTHRWWIGRAYSAYFDDWSVSDSDGRGDVCDNCPLELNADQSDLDGDTLGDVCDPCPLDPYNDIDDDGVCGDEDNCPQMANPDQEDQDGDGTGDVCDNCPLKANADQRDLDGDALGDVCDPCPLDAENDADGDGMCADIDRCPYENPNGVDADDDGCIDLINDFEALVVGLEILDPDVEQGLLDSIAAAFASIEAERYRPAANQLGAFINKVKAQRGKAIPEADADMLIAFALNIVESFP